MTSSELEPPADRGRSLAELAAAAEGPDAQDEDRTVPLTAMVSRARVFLRRHGSRLWWLHSVYALSLGIFVVMFAREGYDHARVVVAFMGAAWLMLIALFRLFGSGEERSLDTTRERLRYYAMTYVLKNLHQGMLFFLLPFYWQSTTVGSPNQYFVAVLAVCALLSTLDVVFDRVLMRWRPLASTFYGLILFACLNLTLPAIFPDASTLVSTGAAAVIAVIAFGTIHHPTWFLDAVSARRMGLGVMGGLLVALLLRPIVPPVPMYVASAAVGPQLLPDGRLALQISAVHKDLAQQMFAVTDVVMAGADARDLHHVWRFRGAKMLDLREGTQAAPAPGHRLRLSSRLPPGRLPPNPVGPWSVDVVTADGRLVGRAAFEITR